MMRLLGVLVGSALAVAALVVFVGIPQVQTESTVAPIGDNGVIRLPARPSPEVAPEVAPELVAEPADVAVDEAARLVAEAPPVEPIAAFLTSDTVLTETQWYAFWSPFRSEIAANGFVAQLQRVTGLDYRVVKVKAGVYEVAFAYSEDDEILSNLSQISAATGLQLPEG